MNWIKVTPETMPNSGERVNVTMFCQELNKPITMWGVWWDGAKNGWYVRAYDPPLADGVGIYHDIEISGVTHWMPLPLPAAD